MLSSSLPSEVGKASRTRLGALTAIGSDDEVEGSANEEEEVAEGQGVALRSSNSTRDGIYGCGYCKATFRSTAQTTSSRSLSSSILVRAVEEEKVGSMGLERIRACKLRVVKLAARPDISRVYDIICGHIHRALVHGPLGALRSVNEQRQSGLILIEGVVLGFCP